MQKNLGCPGLENTLYFQIKPNKSPVRRISSENEPKQVVTRMVPYATLQR